MEESMRKLLVLIVVMGSMAASVAGLACPFCTATQTFSDDLKEMDAVLIAELTETPATPQLADDNELPTGKFKVTRVLKGDSLVKLNQVIEATCPDDVRAGSPFLLLGVDPKQLIWSTPVALTTRSREYIERLPGLPKEGVERLEYFQQYLEDPERILAEDAYGEFAKAPYAVVQALKPKMEREKLVNWIKDPDIAMNHRRLYLTMLGVCGGLDDAAMLEGMLKSNDRKMKAGLDALVACYLTLKGATGMQLIEDLYLRNATAENADTYAAITAIRFHGNEAKVIPKERLVVSLRHMLDRPQMADLVISDLTSWADWTVMDRMVELFKSAEPKNSWVRVPIIQYLRACPKSEAKKHIEDLEKIDPAAVRRANTIFPVKAS
jgi:hypothetical protein